MSHDSETKNVEPEASNKFADSDDATEEHDQEENITAVDIQAAKDPVKSSQSKEEFKDTSQQNNQPIDSSQFETDSSKANQKPAKSSVTQEEKLGSSETSEENLDSSETKRLEEAKPDINKQNQDQVETAVKSQEHEVKEAKPDSKKNIFLIQKQNAHLTDSGRIETDSTKANQKPEESPESQKENADSSETSQRKPKGKQDHVEIIVRDQEHDGKEGRPFSKENKSLRQIIIWTVAEFFDTNPRYLTKIRGVANLIHIVLSLTNIVLLSLICQLRPFPNASHEGFFCKPPETFLFTASCCSFFTAVLYLFCCVFSQSTDFLLFQSAFEVGYFILYFILLLTAGMVVLVNEMGWDESEEWYFKNDRRYVEGAAAVGLINSIIYALSAVWFFMSHCQQEGSVIEVPEW